MERTLEDVLKMIIASFTVYKNIFSEIEKRTTINQLEKLNRISNRRLSVDDKVHPLKLSWSIDRITIVGKLKEKRLNTPFFVILFRDFERSEKSRFLS